MKIQPNSRTRAHAHRGLRITVVALCVALALIGALFAVLYLREQSDRHDCREALLADLINREGEYDAQSIVLANTSRGVADRLAEKLGASLRITADGSFATLTLPEGVTFLDVCQDDAYLADLAHMSIDFEARVSELEEDETDDGLPQPLRPQFDVDDVGFSSQTYLDYVDLKRTWESHRGGGVLVAVIDTGIDTDHPEFAGRISELSYNATEDKIVRDYLVNGDYDWSLIEDEQGHGTSVAGVLGAPMHNGGIVGVAPEVTLLVIKAECNPDGSFKRTSDLVFGLYYAIECDARVVNMSLGSKSEINPFAEATRLAVDSDVICVAAAGNDSTAEICYPAADPNVIGVGALEDGGWGLASYSNFGENVDVVAPGTTYTAKMGGGYSVTHGTSLACPVVAGAVALYAGEYSHAEFSEVCELLFASCSDLGDLGRDWYFGYGALDIDLLINGERGTVTFNMMTDELENTEQIFIRNHTLQNMPEPDRLYAVFDGWYYDPQCTEEYNWYADEFSSDLTLYANWVNEEDGIPYTYVELDDGTVEIRSYTGHRRYITIPSTIEGKVVSSIGRSAFAGETRLRQINLPERLVRICPDAFAGCSSLSGIEIPDSVTEIGEGAFANNIRLSYVAFGSNSRLASIGKRAFLNCAHLRSITLPASLTEVNGTAFLGTTSMTSYTVQSGNTSFAARDGVLLTADGRTLVAYPAGITAAYTLPASVEVIGPAAFAHSRIDTLDLASVSAIGDSAFISARLTSVTIPDSVTSLGASAFEKCASLESVTLGAGLTSIPSNAFVLCQRLGAIEIPAGIVTIGENAFAFTSALTDLTFAPNSRLEKIDSAAFSGFGVERLTLPASLEIIGQSAFAMSGLTELHFAPDSALREIGKSAFAQNASLCELSLPTTLESIGEFAFRGTGLVAVSLPASLQTLGDGAFADCHALTAITAAPESTRFASSDGILFDHALSTLLVYPAGSPRTDYTIPNTVAVIGPQAFRGAWNLSDVSLSGFSLQKVSEYAFYDCRAITSYTVPATLTEIGRYAFAKNSALRAFTLPSELVQLSSFAFAENWNLDSLSFMSASKLARIGYGAFAYCGINSIEFPAGVSSIAQGAFEGCSKLRDVTFAAGSALPSISAYMFDGCSSLCSITFAPGSKLTSIQAHGLEGMRSLLSLDLGDAKLTNIDNFAFRFCESLSSFSIPDGVTYVGRYAFYGCTALESVVIPASVEYIGRYAFLGTERINLYFEAGTLPRTLQEDWDHGIAGYYLGVSRVTELYELIYATLTDGSVALIEYRGSEKQLDLNALALELGGPIVTIGGKAFYYSPVESVILPDSLVTIQSGAFYHASLRAVTIPASVTFIGRDAFADTPIETLTIPADSALRTIEQSAFENTKRLTSVTLPASLEVLGRAAFKNSGISSLSFAQAIALTEIPEEAFAYTAITSLTLPDSVTLINHNAFRETASLASVTFGNAEELMLMSNVFYRSGLQSLTVPKNLSYVGEYALVALPRLERFEVDPENPYYKAVDGLLLSKDGRRLIAVPAGRTGSLTVPEGVEIIGFGAFEYSALSEINFPEDANILSLGYRAFYGCERITSMRIPASVVAIDYYAFAGCTSLKSVEFAKGCALTGIYEGAFLGCISLSDVTLPDSVIEISDFAFYSCAALDRVPVSENTQLKGIYSYAMAHTGLRGEFRTPEGLTDIGDYAFSGTKITSATIPATHAHELLLGIGVFRDCNSMEEVTVPFLGASFEDHEITWFSYLFGAGSAEASEAYLPTSLHTVTIPEGLTTVGKNAFRGIRTIKRINLPQSISALENYAFHECLASYELTGTVSLDATVLDYFNQYFGEGMRGTLRLSEGLERIEVPIPGRIEGLVLPASLTYVESPVFNMNQQLTSIEVAQGSRTYSSLDGVLYNKEGNEIVAVPGGITGCITLPATLTAVPPSAFLECHKITEVILPEGVTEIGSEAFAGCMNMTRIMLPSTLQSIGSDAFRSCWSLFVVQNNSSLSLDFNSEEHGGVAYYARTILNADGSIQFIHGLTDSEYLQTEDGFHFLKLGGDYTLIAYLGNEEHVRLPETVRGQSYRIEHMIGGKHITVPGTLGDLSIAFTDNQTLRSVVLESGITHLGDSAFAACHALESVTLPEGLESIASGAFYMCSSMTDLVLPKTLKRIGNEVFDSCAGLDTLELPEGLTEIGNGAFRYCSSLKSLTLPASLTSIGSGAFEFCESLATLRIADGNRHFVEENGIVYNHTRTELVFVTPTVSGRIALPSTLREIPPSAFNGLKAVTAVEIPEGLVSIGYGAFTETSITEISLPRSLRLLDSDALCTETLTEIHYGGSLSDWIALDRGYSNTRGAVDLYINGERLTDVVIPEGVTEIPTDTFTNLTVERVTLPSTLQTIGERAFQRCTALESLHLPASLSRIGDNAFAECSALRRITVDSESPYFSVSDGVLYNKGMTEIRLVPSGLCGSITIPEGVTAIPDFTFEMRYLASLTLPSTIQSLGEHAFANMDVGIIRNNSSCPIRIFSMNTPGTYINAKCLVDRNGNRTYYENGSDFEVIFGSDGFLYTKERGNYRMRAYLGDEETVTLPLTFNGQPYTPESVQGIKHLVIPAGFTEIASHAFSWSNSLCSVSIPDGVTSIGTAAFAGCPNLREISIPDSVRMLGGNLIEGSRYALNAENWSADGLLLVGKHLISVATDLEHVTVPADIRSISETAFEDCFKVKEVTLRGDYVSPYLLAPLSNLETLILTDSLDHPISDYFYAYSIPITLKSIVLQGDLLVNSDRMTDLLADLQNVSVYVQSEEKDLRWDESFPGWSNGNTVLYGSRWVLVSFFDANGKLIERAPFSSAQVIRTPWVDSYTDNDYRYRFAGFDLDGDGIADALPATSTAWINATAVFSRELRCLEEGHRYTAGESINGELHTLVCVCGATSEGAHSWTAPTVITPATHTSEGSQELVCAGCHHKKTESIPKTAEHTFDQYTASDDFYAAPATCMHSKGYYVSCICGAHGDEIFYPDSFDSNAHPMDGVTYTYDDTEHRFMCKECFNTVINAHEWSDWHTDPNRGNASVRSCTVCGYEQVRSSDPAPDHPNNPNNPGQPDKPSEPNGGSTSSGGCFGSIGTHAIYLILLTPLLCRKKRKEEG